MMKTCSRVLLFLLLSLPACSWATIAQYTFSASNGTYTPLTSGTDVATGFWDENSAIIAMPFSFVYHDVPNDHMVIHANGFVRFGLLPGTYYCGLQSSGTDAIAAYGTDLVGVSATSHVRYATLGSAPDRRFVIEWADCDHYGNGQQNHLSFQLVLTESTNTVQVIFGPMTVATTFGPNQCTASSNESGDVGLLGSTLDDFNMRRVTAQSNTWATSAAAAALSDVCNLSPNLIPSAGLTWTWTPPAPIPMAFESATTALVSNGQVDPRGGSTGGLLRIRVTVSGSLDPFNVSSLALQTTGSTDAQADIAAARVYFTGSDDTFLTTVPFGSVSDPAGAYTVSGSATLSQGDNYFWLAYDLRSSGTIGHVVAGCCMQLTGSGSMGARVPTVTCPAGSHTIGDQAGSWTALANASPHACGGLALLLSDGSVMMKTQASSNSDGYGDTWDRLVPDGTGSYVNGTWSTLAPMADTRLYFSSQVMKDGRVYVAGGEYGTGGAAAEVYDPLTNAWTPCPPPGNVVSDANSIMLEDGRVLQALVSGSLQSTRIYDPSSNAYVNGPTCIGIHNESSWVKLPDNSVLMVDRGGATSERYMPATNSWVADAPVPVALYDPFGDETGPALLLADGRAFFLGSTGHSAFYLPSGTAAPGTWVAGPDLPNGQGTPDATAALLTNGKVLLTAGPAPTAEDVYLPPTAFYEFDPATNSYVTLPAPGGGASIPVAVFVTNTLELPDGSILYLQQGVSQLHVYRPSGDPVASARPTISSVAQEACGVYTITGTQFNGVSEGAYYGDDWQMSTNFPIVRLTAGPNVYYARTFNWNSTGVRRGAQPDHAQFTLPSGLPPGNYTLEVVANGIASMPVNFTPSTTIAPAVAVTITDGANPTTPGANITFTATASTAGPSPTFQWKVNGANVGANSPSYSTTTLTDGQVVTCVVTSSLACAAPLTATSNPITITAAGSAVSVSLRAFLEGPYVQAAGLMHDSLRVKGLIPLMEPFTGLGYVFAGGGGGETIAAAVLSATGNNAIVDWVIVELRSGTDPSTVLAGRVALLQRDGDIVALDGTSPVLMPVGAGNYYVAVRHRNHLGAMTATTRALSSVTTSVDLTTAATTTYGTGARKAVGTALVLLQGNARFDGQLAYAGANNDRDPILMAIGGDQPNVVITAYRSEDVNMDGKVKYTGVNNDRDPILVNIGGSVPTNVLFEQLP